MRQVANHDFSGLSMPILVACYSKEQFEDFVFREGLMCSEVRRLKGKREDFKHLPENKILLLLPGWDRNPPTKDLADWWIFMQDRYTCYLRAPRPVIDKKRFPMWEILAVSGILWMLALLVWMTFRA